MAVRNPIRDKVVIASVGHAGCFRDAKMSMGKMAVNACRLAVEDAGISLQDVDGFGTAGGFLATGWNDVNSGYMIEALGLPGVRWWHDAPLGGVPGFGSVAETVLAVASGQCDVALTCRINWRPKDIGYGYVQELRAAGKDQWFNPYGYGRLPPEVFFLVPALYVRVRVHARRTLGPSSCSRGRTTSGNEKGVAPRVPLTMDDYLSARMISDPMRLLDNDFPCDGAAAVVGHHAPATRGSHQHMKQTPVYVSAVATGQGPRPDFVFWHDHTEMLSHWAVKDLWEKAGFKREDMDLAQLYDGFSPFIFYWLEALGYAPRGEGAKFVADGNVKPDGVLPLNLNGGQLNEGRLHCIGHVIEAVLQLQGRAGKRQLKKAEAAVTAGGGLSTDCIMVLHK